MPDPKVAKTVLITGGSDGLGQVTAAAMVQAGHTVLLHGRNPEKTRAAAQALGLEALIADLSDLGETLALANQIERLDVLINNAGIYKTPQPNLPNGLDVRFMVNAIAPYALTKALLPKLAKTARVVNLSSAAQAPVNLAALQGHEALGDQMAYYAQSKLAITQWTGHMASLYSDGPLFVAVNPGSLLATKMVREGFGMSGNDISIGVDALRQAAFSKAFEGKSGAYFDQDIRSFGPPHPDAQDPAKCAATVEAIEKTLEQL